METLTFFIKLQLNYHHVTHLLSSPANLLPCREEMSVSSANVLFV